eukprot:scaffold2707_cov417-Prasinococcus_capsulatus_cf.AAC.21
MAGRNQANDGLRGYLILVGGLIVYLTGAHVALTLCVKHDIELFVAARSVERRVARAQSM